MQTETEQLRKLSRQELEAYARILRGACCPSRTVLIDPDNKVSRHLAIVNTLLSARS